MIESNNKLVRAGLISEYEEIFVCPICLNPMKVADFKSLVCSDNHCFDISKQGYINLLPRPSKTKYDKKLFASRKKVIELGLFDPLINRISEIIMGGLEQASAGNSVKVLDAGCGEGSHLTAIRQKLMKQADLDLLGVGIDISKEGIVMASKRAPEMIWCVADLANSPFAGKQFDFILNILSPSNYAEFKRMLDNDGKVIKVIPGTDYLRELRDIFYERTDKGEYSNQNTIDLFAQNFELVDMERVQYIAALEHEHIEPLIQMTPLSWGASEEFIAHVRNQDKIEMTFDFSILLGKN